MAGAILVSQHSGVPFGSVDFDYIIEAIRPRFIDGEELFRDEIYSPVDEGGMSYISLEDQSHEGFNAFLRAASLAYENEMRIQPTSPRQRCWEPLISALRSDARAATK